MRPIPALPADLGSLRAGRPVHLRAMLQLVRPCSFPFPRIEPAVGLVGAAQQVLQRTSITLGCSPKQNGGRARRQHERQGAIRHVAAHRPRPLGCHCPAAVSPLHPGGEVRVDQQVLWRKNGIQATQRKGAQRIPILRVRPSASKPFHPRLPSWVALRQSCPAGGGANAAAARG